MLALGRPLRLVLPLLAGGCGTPGEPRPDAGGEFIAIAADFRDFRSWERIDIDATAAPAGMTGEEAAVYASRRAPAGSTRFEPGTMLVKTIETGAPTDWTIHAMVKRGGAYNVRGAIGWEFFELRLEPDGTPVVLWRGEGPSAGHGYGRELADGGVLELVCNDCHGASWTTDGVLTPALAPMSPDAPP
jgi:hypothetical protein